MWSPGAEVALFSGEQIIVSGFECITLTALYTWMENKSSVVLDYENNENKWLLLVKCILTAISSLGSSPIQTTWVRGSALHMPLIFSDISLLF